VKEDDRTRRVGDSDRPSLPASVQSPKPADESVVEPLHADRLVTLGQLAAIAAHDINGQLMAAQHNVSTAVRIAHGLDLRSDPDACATLIVALSEAEQAMAHIATIVQDMTLSARATDAQVEPVRLDQVARAALRVTAGFLRGRASVAERLQPVSPLMGRSGALVQLTVNLLMNAAQALEASGATPTPRIVVETYTQDGSARLVVQDNGPGVAHALQTHIFERYFTTKPPGSGTGLGLSICREIAEQHGGRLELVSSSEPGARFELVLPFSTTEPESP
jgi:C4-dicarboxylate-specific signal transduction histidine kinase